MFALPNRFSVHDYIVLSLLYVAGIDSKIFCPL
jgi:hypothetical protein